MRPTADPMYTHLFLDNRPRHSSITVTCTSSGTKARFQHQPLPSNSFRTIRIRRIAGLTLQPRRTAPTSSREDAQTKASSLTIQNRIDDNLGSASSMVETWLRCVVILPDEHTCPTFSIARLGFHCIVSESSANR